MSAVGRAEYPIRGDGIFSPLRQLPFNARGVIVHNNFNFAIRLFDGNGNYWDTPAGLVNVINPSDDFYAWRAVCPARFETDLVPLPATGTGTVEFYNIRQPANNVPLQQPAGVATVAIQSGSVTILGSPTIQIAAGQNVGITGTVTVAGNVNISNTPNVNIGATGSVLINNTNPITFINPDVVSSTFALDNQTAQITLSRLSELQILQPILSTLLRTGLLSVWATDSTAQTYEFLRNEPFVYAGTPFLGVMIPFKWLRDLKSGAVVNIKFTGKMSFIYGY